MEKLSQYFMQWRSNHDILVEAAWFHLCFYFGRRGREGWASMTKDTFVFEQDAEGHEYVAFAKTETTKNHQGGYKQRDIDYSDQRMYGQGVEILKYLLGKLHPDNERLFQDPLVAYKSDGHWFKKEPMGKNTLGNIMQRISSKAGLSMRYTYHCVRASTITILYRAAIDTPSIRSISKHKSTTGLLPYLSDLSNFEKRECSSALTKAFAQQPVGSPVASTSKDTEGWDLHSDIMDVRERDVQSDQYAQGVSVIQASPGGTVTLPMPADDKEALYQVALQPTATVTGNNAQWACYVDQQQSACHEKWRLLPIWSWCNVQQLHFLVQYETKQSHVTIGLRHRKYWPCSVLWLWPVISCWKINYLLFELFAMYFLSMSVVIIIIVSPTLEYHPSCNASRGWHAQ